MPHRKKLGKNIQVPGYGEGSISGTAPNPEKVTAKDTEEHSESVGWSHNIDMGREKIIETEENTDELDEERNN